MKRLLFLTMPALWALSCNPRRQEANVPKIDSSTSTHKDTPTTSTDTHYFWQSAWDEKKGMVMKKAEPLGEDSLTPEILIQKLNRIYPDIELQLLKRSHDSIFVRVKKSNYLTQQIGSSGALEYLAVVTYNLTEIRDVNYVDIRFKEGDHASPGTYSRTDFVGARN